MSDESLHEAISDLEKVIRKYHLSYDQFHYVAKEARKRLNLMRHAGKQRVIDRLTKDEQSRLIRSAYGLAGNRGLLIKTLLCTGTRVSEFIEIQVSDVMIHEQSIFIRKAKGGKQRAVPITESLAQELNTYLNGRKTGYLFESRNHDQYTSRRIQQIVKEIALKAGIAKKVHPHLLRHTVATFLLE